MLIDIFVHVSVFADNLSEAGSGSCGSSSATLHSATSHHDTPGKTHKRSVSHTTSTHTDMVGSQSINLKIEKNRFIKNFVEKIWPFVFFICPNFFHIFHQQKSRIYFVNQTNHAYRCTWFGCLRTLFS